MTRKQQMVLGIFMAAVPLVALCRVLVDAMGWADFGVLMIVACGIVSFITGVVIFVGSFNKQGT